jgi:hypothetical protein
MDGPKRMMANLFCRRMSLVLLAWLGASATGSGAGTRTFHSAEGKPLQATFEGMAGDQVKLRREDGKTFELALEKLSVADQTYIKEAVASAGNESKKLNAAAGQEIANGSPFSTRKAEELAGALKLHPESRSRYGASWRLYAAFEKNYRLFGAMPYSVALYSDADGLVTSLSIVYANKGDFGSAAGFGTDHFNGGTNASAVSLAGAMAKDEKSVSKSLTTALGEGKIQRYGEGDTRREITRWDWNGHAFLLSNEENEYVGLSIVSTGSADAGGKSLRVKDGEVKQRLLDSIVRSDNGDVYLSEIPMVDQGPKGYCVPATFERAMRTMGLEADMYLLAMVGQSMAGGGTSVELLLENVRSQVYRKGRRTKDDNLKQLRIRDLRRYLDQGIPVMWTMLSVPEYNKVADANTAKRASVKDWKAYAEEIKTEAADITAAPKPEDKHHICMIIGYNETTQEIAVSDSWGARFERRWVPVSVADWASQGGVFMILP